MILRQDFDRRYASYLAAFLHCAHDTSKLHSCLSLCFGRVWFVALVFPRLHFDVKLQFFLQLFIHPATEKQSAQAHAKVLPLHITPSLIP